MCRMWTFLIPLVFHPVYGLPAARDPTSTCAQDAIYTSLTSDGLGYCSDVLRNAHCGGGYSTPAPYVTYNQTQISSYCQCILTNSSAWLTTSSFSSSTFGDLTKTGASSGSTTSDRISISSPGSIAESSVPGSSTSSSAGIFSATTLDSTVTQTWSNTTRPGTSATRARTVSGTSETQTGGLSPNPANQTVTGSQVSASASRGWNFTSDTNSLVTTFPPTNIPITINPITSVPSVNITSILQSRSSPQNSISVSSSNGTRPNQFPWTRTSTSMSWNSSVPSISIPETNTLTFTATLNLSSSKLSSISLVPSDSSTSSSPATWFSWNSSLTSKSVPATVSSSISRTITLSRSGSVSFSRSRVVTSSRTLFSWNSSLLTISTSPLPTLSNLSRTTSAPVSSIPSESNTASKPSTLPGWNSSIASNTLSRTASSLVTSTSNLSSTIFAASSRSSAVPGSASFSWNSSVSSINTPGTASLPSSASLNSSNSETVSGSAILSIQTSFSGNSPSTTPTVIESASSSWIGPSNSSKLSNSMTAAGSRITSTFSVTTGSSVSPGTRSQDSSTSEDSSLSLSTRVNGTTTVSGSNISTPLHTGSAASTATSPMNSTSLLTGSSGSSQGLPVSTSPTNTVTLPSGTSSQGSNTTSSAISEFLAANFTQVTRAAAVAQESCYSLARDPKGNPTRRVVLRNAKLREDNVTIPVPYVESVQFDSTGIDPLYLTVRDKDEGIHYIDISNQDQIAIADTDGNTMLIDDSGIYLSANKCSFSVSITISNMLQQLRSLAGVQCAAVKRRKRREDIDFTQVLNMHDQCGQPVDRTLRQYPRLRVGNSPCTDIDVDEGTGRWEFDCTFPGSESGSIRCQWAIKNDIVDFLITDPFEGNCPDVATVITTLGTTANDFLSSESFRSALRSQHLDNKQRGEADAAASAFGRLWEVFQQMLSTSRENPSGNASPLEQYINAYNEHRNFVEDICEDLHAGEIPFNLSLSVGATHIDGLTTLNWAPVNTRPYNITIQNPSAIACCPNGTVAQHNGDTCGYPASAAISGTSCICGVTAGGRSVGFEYVECDNFVSECGSDGDCQNAGYAGFVCLTGSCCGGGVCVDPYVCSQDGIDLVKFGGSAG